MLLLQDIREYRDHTIMTATKEIKTELGPSSLMKCVLTYLMKAAVVVGFWRRVFTRSSGWKRTVEHDPEIAPARNDLKTGYCNTNERLGDFRSLFRCFPAYVGHDFHFCTDLSATIALCSECCLSFDF